MLSPQQAEEMVTELSELVKMEIEIDGVVVYVTNIIFINEKLKVDFFTQCPEREDEIKPHVETCIMKLISDEERKQVCNSKNPFSRICSKIKNILRW